MRRRAATLLVALVIALGGLTLFSPAPPASACRPATAAGAAACDLIRQQYQGAPKKKVRKHHKHAVRHRR